MKTELLVVLLTLACGVFAQAQQEPQGHRPDGYWRLESVSCKNGSAGKLRYESVQMRLWNGTAKAELVNEGCVINIAGSFSIVATTMTTEFSEGTWTACSGSLPSYIFNRFEFRREQAALFLTGTDLSPFATCNGEGELHFIAD